MNACVFYIIVLLTKNNGVLQKWLINGLQLSSNRIFVKLEGLERQTFGTNQFHASYTYLCICVYGFMCYGLMCPHACTYMHTHTHKHNVYYSFWSLSLHQNIGAMVTASLYMYKFVWVAKSVHVTL